MRKSLILAISIIFILLLSTLITIRPTIQTVKAQQQTNASYSDNFSTDSGLWTYLGGAYRNPTNQDLVLTNSGFDQAGAVFFDYPVSGSFTANFSYIVGGGYSGDGFTMFFYKQQYLTLDSGGSLAFSSPNQPIPGYGIEFDGWQNPAGDFQSYWAGQPVNPPQGDPSAAYIGLIQNDAGNHLAYVNDERVADNNWHQVSVIVTDSSVSVLVDQELDLQWTGVLNTSYSGFGFSGATGGGGTNYHIIGNFSISLGTPESVPSGTTNTVTLQPVTSSPTTTATSSPTALPSPSITPSPIISPSPIAPPVLTETNQSTESFSDNFSTNTGAWTYLGDAYRDTTNDYIVLTNDDYSQAGVAFFSYPISGSFVANFSYLVSGGGGYPGDGFTMFFYKQPYSILDSGGSLAFSSPNQPIPGYGIEFDSWQNPAGDYQYAYPNQPINPPTGDPPAPYIGLIEDYAGNHLAYTTVDPGVSGGEWHQVSVQVTPSSVSVYVDQGLVLQWTGTLNTTYSGFGFSGATGCATAQHLISDFSITAQNLQPPQLTTSCVDSVSQSSLNVNINGYLTSNGTGISGAPILLSYSVTGGQSWEDLTLVNTGPDGSYSALWFPSVTGDYLIKAVYQGNINYPDTSNTVNFDMEPCTEQTIFSVVSNLTISELCFNSASNELSFNASGPSGTTGHVNVYIPKSLMSDVSDLSVSLNGNPILYNAESQGNAWLISFNCQNSNNEVTMGVNVSDSIVVNGNQLELWLPYGIIIMLVAVISVLLTSRKTKKIITPKQQTQI